MFGNISWFNRCRVPVRWICWRRIKCTSRTLWQEDKESLALCMLKRKRVHLIKSKKSLKLPKRQAAVNRRTDNTMTNRKQDKQWSTKHYTENKRMSEFLRSNLRSPVARQHFHTLSIKYPHPVCFFIMWQFKHPSKTLPQYHLMYIIFSLVFLILSCINVRENQRGVMKNWQSRDTGNIRHTRHTAKVNRVPVSYKIITVSKCWISSIRAPSIQDDHLIR